VTKRWGEENMQNNSAVQKWKVHRRHVSSQDDLQEINTAGLTYARTSSIVLLSSNVQDLR